MSVAVAFWFGLLVVGHAAGRLYGSYTVRRGGDDDRRSRGTYRLLSLIGLTAVVGLTLSGLVDATETALSSLHPALAGGLAAPLAWVPTGIGAIIAVLVTYLGVFPYARERRGLEISAATAVGRLAKYLVAIAVLCLGLIAPVIVLVGLSDPSPVLIPLLFAVLLFWIAVWTQYSVQLSQEIVEPTVDQRRRLEAAADRADTTIPLAGVIPGEETETAGLYLGGSFRNRRVYATDYTFDALDNDELTALCARVTAADDLRLPERRALVVSLLLGLFLTLTIWRSMTVALLALAIVWPLLSWYLQRCAFAADRRAADEVGADDLASAYEATEDLADDRGRLHERLAPRPSTARRLERLRH